MKRAFLAFAVAAAPFLWQVSAEAAAPDQIQAGKGPFPNSVTAINEPPHACIGPYCIEHGLVLIEKCQGATTTFQLDASLSYDPEGQPLTYQWFVGPGAVLSAPTSPITSVTVDTSTSCEQFLAVRLRVSDGSSNAHVRAYLRVLDPVDICPAKPSAIEWVYLGTDCSASNYIQDPANVRCLGDPMGASPVRIVMTHTTQPSRVYFDGIVSLGDTFVELGSAGFKNGKVPPNTRVQIFDMAGQLLQDSSFHTSCSQPLQVGDQFGAVIISDFTP